MFLKITEEKIPFGERVTLAVTQFFRTLCACVTAFFLLPVFFIRTLFTTTRRVIDVEGAVRGFQQQQGQQEQSGYTEEDWQKLHKDLYEEEDKDDKDETSQ